jgi:Cdc6-like AAA superfamily ATPase
LKTLESFAKAEIKKDTPSIGIEVQSIADGFVIDIADGFVIDDIELKDFMRYTGKSDSITFPQKLTVITGKTGAGKTSILDAITYALYNKSSRTDIQAVKTSDICKAGGYVKLSFFQSSFKEIRGMRLREDLPQIDRLI